MTPISYVATGERTSPQWCAAFAEGCGGDVRFNRVIDHTRPAAFFGSPKLRAAFDSVLESGQDYYYGDHGYFNRFQYYRCTKNAMQHTGKGDAGPERFNALGIKIQPWRTTGKYILICPPDEIFGKYIGINTFQWLKNVRKIIRQYTHRQFIIRDRTTKKSLQYDFSHTWAVVTHMSNIAVDAVINGIPVFCTGPCAGLTMGLSDLSRIESPVKPNREQWLYNLAANQWTLDEMKRGILWEALK